MSAIGLRLEAITDLVNREYEAIFDTCCDHGKLGMYFLRNTDVSEVTFIDQVEKIIRKLESNLADSESYSSDRYTTICGDASHLESIKSHSLICICGVGGRCVMDIIKGLEDRNDLSEVDIIVDAQYQIYELRKFLKERGFGIIEQKLIFEGKWAHEIMYLSKKGNTSFSLTGKELFDKQDARHISYLQALISHYNLKSRRDQGCEEIANSYKEILE